MLKELNESQAEHQISAWMQDDSDRMQALQALLSVSEATGQELWLSAGFVRNLVWDKLYHNQVTPLNDLDVIYFDQHNLLPEFDLEVNQLLTSCSPQFPWSVKNQARMHLRNGDSPYQNLCHAMSCWPEQETAVALRLTQAGQLEFQSAFGLKCLFNGFITHNESRELELFLYRVKSKGWLTLYPQLCLRCNQSIK